MDGYAQAPLQTQNMGSVSVDLPTPPKWMRKPVGASFGFGGKLISFTNEKPSAQVQSNQNGNVPIISRTVQISQIVTEENLVQDSAVMENILELGNFVEYCNDKADHADDQHKKYIWNFIKAQFAVNPKEEILNLLGYKNEDVNNELNKIVGKNSNDKELWVNMKRIEDFDLINDAQNVKKPVQPFKIHVGNGSVSDTEGLITQALLLGNVEAAVELCLKAKRFTDAIIIATTGGSDLLARTQQKYLEQTEGYISSLISALVTDDWKSIVENCDITSWKEALSATLTRASKDDLPLLCEKLGYRLETEAQNDDELLNKAHLCYVISGSLEKLVRSWRGNVYSSTKDLKELVELVVLLQKAMERQGRQVPIHGLVTDLLSNYAMILVSQGCSKEALTYLGSSNNKKLSALRDRLLVHLGQKPAYGQPVRQQSRHSIGKQSFTNYIVRIKFRPKKQFGVPPTNQFGVPPSQFGVQPPSKFGGPTPNQYGVTSTNYAASFRGIFDREDIVVNQEFPEETKNNKNSRNCDRSSSVEEDRRDEKSRNMSYYQESSTRHERRSFRSRSRSGDRSRRERSRSGSYRRRSRSPLWRDKSHRHRYSLERRRSRSFSPQPKTLTERDYLKYEKRKANRSRSPVGSHSGKKMDEHSTRSSVERRRSSWRRSRTPSRGRRSWSGSPRRRKSRRSRSRSRHHEREIEEFGPFGYPGAPCIFQDGNYGIPVGPAFIPRGYIPPPMYPRPFLPPMMMPRMSNMMMQPYRPRIQRPKLQSSSYDVPSTSSTVQHPLPN